MKDDTDRMEQSNGVPIEILDRHETWPYESMAGILEVEDEQIEEASIVGHDGIDISDGVPLMSSGNDDTEPSLPTNRVSGKALPPS